MSPTTPLDVFHCPLQGSALIEASAGTGKTWAMTGLVLRLLAESALPIDAILVVTFTKAATAELKSRIRDRLVETLGVMDGNPPGPDPFVADFLRVVGERVPTATIRERLGNALAAFDEAAIFTIHGFCQRALAETPFAAGQPFALEVTDDQAICHEVATDFWRRFVAFGPLDPAFAAWLAEGHLDLETLTGLLRTHLSKPLAVVRWPEGSDQPAPVNGEALSTAYQRAAKVWAAEENAIMDLLRAALPGLNGTVFNADKIEQGGQGWADYFAAGQPLAEVLPYAANFRLTKLKTKKGATPPEHDFFPIAEDLLSTREAVVAGFARQRWALLRQAVDWGLPEIRRRKRERRQVAFDDLLYNLHAALQGDGGEALARTLRQRYPAALIDEFQDTDPLQFAIFQRLYAAAPEGENAPTLFLVGDPKQAIYSFRQADLHTYMRAREQAGTHYALSHNQRSSAELIAAVNGLFVAHEAPFMFPGLGFTPAGVGSKPRKAFVDQSLPRSALNCWQLPPDADGEPLRKEKALSLAAQASAAEIARLLAESRAGRVTLGGLPLAAGDIAVLVRTHQQGRRIKAALAAHGLMAAELSQASVFASAEAAALLRLLQSVAEPGRPERLRAALATELLGLDAAALLALQADDSALTRWLARCQHWLALWEKRGIVHALAQAQADAGISARLLALPEGERRLTNLRHLVELLHQAEFDHPSPEALLAWFAHVCANPQQGEEAQLRLESDRDLVSIVTIHKSKGLEYAVVFCPFLFEGVTARSQGSLSYHDDTGQTVVDYRDEAEIAASGDEAKARARQEQAAELLRLYYVALTRAEHRGYLCCGTYGIQYKSVSTTESGKALLNWLVGGAGQTPAQWLEKGLPPEAVAMAWEAYGARLPGQVLVAPVPTIEVPAGSGGLASPTLAAQVSARKLAPAWRMESFSGLMRGASHGDAQDAADHDAHAQKLPTPSVPPPAGDILAFPRGPQAGDCIHHVFEHGEFTDPATWDKAITSALSAFPPGGTLPAPQLAAMLRQMMSDVMATELPGGIRLGEVSPRSRVAELEFTLAAPQLDITGLQTLLRQHGLVVPQLAYTRLQGWLRGFMDLVFAWQGRYYVLDWKSNHLGNRIDDYHLDAMAAAMADHGYTLQALIYSLALHRHLALRLPGYDPERHFGGSLYLFVRGVRPGARTGIHAWRPDPGLLQAFSELLQ